MKNNRKAYNERREHDRFHIRVETFRRRYKDEFFNKPLGRLFQEGQDRVAPGTKAQGRNRQDNQAQQDPATQFFEVMDKIHPLGFRRIKFAHFLSWSCL